jgi:hypothetical protein
MNLFVKSALSEETWKYDSKAIPMPCGQAEEDIINYNKLTTGGLVLVTSEVMAR